MLFFEAFKHEDKARHPGQVAPYFGNSNRESGSAILIPLCRFCAEKVCLAPQQTGRDGLEFGSDAHENRPF